MDERDTNPNASPATEKENNSNGQPQTAAGTPNSPEKNGGTRKKSSYRKFRHAPTWIEAACAVALVVITGFYTHYAHQQVQTAQNTLAEIVKQSPEIKKSADAAYSSSTTADATLKSSQEQFRDEERPYVWLTPGLATPTDSMSNTPILDFLSHKWTLGINIQVHNGGHSPAVDVLETKVVMIFDTPKEAWKKADAYAPEFVKGSPLAPDTTMYLLSAGPIVLTDDIVGDLQANRKAMLILARIRYRDIFLPKQNIPYETAFCASINASGMPLGICTSKYNWVK